MGLTPRLAIDRSPSTWGKRLHGRFFHAPTEAGIHRVFQFTVLRPLPALAWTGVFASTQAIRFSAGFLLGLHGLR
ncbi:MAG: hypothetical protein CBB71_09625 [Rhodopirellula sp. TMED11]|nr:MAG: hypothetical protein CBB71_09625 [Rhodopirellula sp. TMED11]